MEPTDIEIDAANNLATAWDNYFQAASVAGVPVGGSTAGAKSAMLGALSGMGAPGAAAAAITAGIAAYWGVVATLAPSLWVVPGFVTTPPATPPPALSSITAGLTGVFASNASGMLPLVAATQQIAAVLHASGGLGGIAILTPPPPAVPIPTPIL